MDPVRHNSPKLLSEGCRPPIIILPSWLYVQKTVSVDRKRPLPLKQGGMCVYVGKEGRGGCHYPFPGKPWPVLSQEPRVTQIPFLLSLP